jgi:hypothetical protein
MIMQTTSLLVVAFIEQGHQLVSEPHQTASAGADGVIVLLELDPRKQKILPERGDRPGATP